MSKNIQTILTIACFGFGSFSLMAACESGGRVGFLFMIGSILLWSAAIIMAAELSEMK